MTDEELEVERDAIAIEERSLLEATARLRETPQDEEGHAAHYERLKAHMARVHGYREARSINARACSCNVYMAKDNREQIHDEVAAITRQCDALAERTRRPSAPPLRSVDNSASLLERSDAAAQLR
jgi:hypothetical protein